MARRTRVEYAGACYHVINRGNYREWIFAEDGAKEAFVECLAEAAVRSKWIVHAWVVMGNHYHLAIETPEANLGAGMQWLQTTFAARFNRFRREQGHLFQGRYKAIVVQRGRSLGRVCHYIDLNPVRAGVTSVAELENYRFGSFHGVTNVKQRPVWQEVSVALREAGDLEDTPAGRRAYRAYLDWVSAEVKAGKAEEYERLSRGWVIGDEGFKAELQTRMAGRIENERVMDPDARKAYREDQWKERLAEILRRIPASKRKDSRASAEWKAIAAYAMKTSTQATNAWLAEALELSTPTFVSRQVGIVRQQKLSADGLGLLKNARSKD